MLFFGVWDYQHMSLDAKEWGFQTSNVHLSNVLFRFNEI